MAFGRLSRNFVTSFSSRKHSMVALPGGGKTSSICLVFWHNAGVLETERQTDGPTELSRTDIPTYYVGRNLDS